MNRWTLALASVAVFAMSANAALKTQYFYQADTDKNVVTPEYSYYTNTIKLSSASAKSNPGKTDVSTVSVAYERGLDDMFSVGVFVPYQFAGKDRGNQGESYDYNGLGDVTIFGKGTYALADNQNLHFGLGLDISFGNQNFTSSKLDAQDGRIALAPYVGYVIGVGGFNLGAKLFFDVAVNTPKQKQPAGNTVDNKGGDTTKLSVFGEMPFTGGLAGLAVAYRSVTAYTLDGLNKGDGTNWIDLDLYATYDVNEMITVVPDIGYSFLQDSNYNEYSASSGYEFRFSLQGRFTF